MTSKITLALIAFSFILVTNSYANECQEGGEEAKVIFEYSKMGYAQCKKIGEVRSTRVLTGENVFLNDTQNWACFNSSINKTENFSIMNSFDGWCDETIVKLNDGSIFNRHYFPKILK